MVLFEDFNDTYSALWQGAHVLFDAEPIRTTEPTLSEAVAEASLNLEHLSAAYIVDAGQYFNGCQSNWAWKELVSLTITSRQLVPDDNRTGINNMLEVAAKTAMRMPKLKSMEIWNGRKSFAGVFRYTAAPGVCKPARITWRSNFDLVLEPRVIQYWTAVAQQQDDMCELQVTQEWLELDTVIKSHGDAVRVLEFSHGVACPVSLWQIEIENGS